MPQTVASDDLLAQHAAVSDAVLAACQAWQALTAQAPASLAQRRARAQALCECVLRHTGLEEAGLIPWLARVLGEHDDLLQTLADEMGALRDLATEVLATSPLATLHDARVRVLCRYACQHASHRHAAWWPRQGLNAPA